MSVNTESPSEPASRINVTVEALVEMREWLDLKMTTGAYSLGLVLELAGHLTARQYDIHSILDEIGILEGDRTRPTRTKPESKFRRSPLIGLWHKHHFQAGFMIENIIREFKRPDSSGTKFFDSVFEPYLGMTTEEFAGPLSHDLVVGVIERRSRDKAMTGEYIVYEKRNDGSNYYLTLGSHRTDHAIRMRVDAYKSADQAGTAVRA